MFFKTVHRTHFKFARIDKSVDGHNQGKPENFPHFCSAAKPTIFRALTSDLHRFCSNRVFRRTKTQSVGPLSFTVQFPMATVKKNVLYKIK
jgi:hypothetical protein